MLVVKSPQKPFIFKAQLIILVALSLWRIWMCFREYETGPFVSLSRTLLDQAPFWALGSGIAAATGWHRTGRRPRLFLWIGTGLLLVAATDLVVVNGTARQSLYNGYWSGNATVLSRNDSPWIHGSALRVTFSHDHQVVVTLGQAPFPIHRGEWSMRLDPLQCTPRLNLRGFGTADYWNAENLHITGSFQMGSHSYVLAAHLKFD